MVIDGQTAVCGLIGNPVAHTRSPLIHNGLAKELSVNLCYEAFPVTEENVGDAVKGAYALGILGLNVTVPHKERVIPYLKDMDGLAKKIGAVNTLVRTTDGYKGYNTDMPGLYRAMLSDGIKADGEKVIILGAGGVARAVAVMLADKAEQIYILNRTLEKAEKITLEVNSYCDRKIVEAMELADYKKLAGSKYLVIQATNVGMHPDCDRTPIEEDAFYEMVKAGYDLIYNPAETLFMKKVKAAGGEAYNGLKMLLYQGIIAFELWTGTKVADEVANKIYQKLKESM